MYATREELSIALADQVALLAAKAVRKRRRFTVALSGGSLMRILGPQLAAAPLCEEIDWSAWHVFWADERCVPLSSPDSNYKDADTLLFKHVAIPRDQIHAVDDMMESSEAAEAYASILAEVFQPEAGQIPRFDLILLGIGEDGHIASLFPKHPLLKETQQWVAPIFDSPKPPPERITLTLPVINNSRHVLFVTAGGEKQSILSEIFRPGPHRVKLPAELVSPYDGDLQWFMDEAAAGKLKKDKG